jgi:hypothetical protein
MSSIGDRGGQKDKQDKTGNKSTQPLGNIWCVKEKERITRDRHILLRYHR